MLTYELNDPKPQNDIPLKGVRPNIVQAIRALSRQELQAAAVDLGHTFLYADLGNAKCKQDILDMLRRAVRLAGVVLQEHGGAVKRTDRVPVQTADTTRLYCGD